MIRGAASGNGRTADIFNVMRYSTQDGPAFAPPSSLKLPALLLVVPQSREPVFPARPPVLRGALPPLRRLHRRLPRAQHRRDRPHSPHRRRCSRCGHCADACVAEARRLAGHHTAVEDLIRELRRTWFSSRNRAAASRSRAANPHPRRTPPLPSSAPAASGASIRPSRPAASHRPTRSSAWPSPPTWCCSTSRPWTPRSTGATPGSGMAASEQSGNAGRRRTPAGGAHSRGAGRQRFGRRSPPLRDYLAGLRVPRSSCCHSTESAPRSTGVSACLSRRGYAGTYGRRDVPLSGHAGPRRITCLGWRTA